MKAATIKSHILESELTDRELNMLVDAIKAKRERMRLEKQASMRTRVAAGTRVMLQNLSPQYINGATGTVKEVRRTRVSVMLDESKGRFGNDAPVTLPLDCLVVLD